MAKRNIWIGMMVTVLALGIIITGCDTGNNEPNILDAYNFSTGNPGTDILGARGLNQSQFNLIKTATGGFHGWVVDEDDLIMVWTGRSAANFSSVANALDGIFGEDVRGDSDGIYIAYGENYDLIFYSVSDSDKGFYISAGTMMAIIWEDLGGGYYNRENMLPFMRRTER